MAIYDMAIWLEIVRSLDSSELRQIESMPGLKSFAKLVRAEHTSSFLIRKFWKRPILSLYTWELQHRIISNIDQIDKQYSFHRASTAPLLDAPANPNLKIPTRRFLLNSLMVYALAVEMTRKLSTVSSVCERKDLKKIGLLSFFS